MVGGLSDNVRYEIGVFGKEYTYHKEYSHEKNHSAYLLHVVFLHYSLQS